MGQLVVRDLHICRSLPFVFAVFRVSFLFVSIFSVVLLHVSFGRSVLLFLWGVNLRAAEGNEYSGIRRTWPIHLHRLCSNPTDVGIMPVYLNRSSFLIALGQNIRLIFLRHLVWKVSNSLAIVWVIFQHSLPFNSTLRTLLLNILHLIIRLIFEDFHELFSVAKVRIFFWSWERSWVDPVSNGYQRELLYFFKK
jgi:hypothetical protein